MKMKSVSSLYKIACYIFKRINRYFDQKTLNVFFRIITHIGDAIFSISLVLCLLIFFKRDSTNYAAAVSLTMSHIPVQMLKRWYPRKRPYLTIQNAKYPSHSLKGYSFPSWTHNSHFFCYHSIYFFLHVSNSAYSSFVFTFTNHVFSIFHSSPVTYFTLQCDKSCSMLRFSSSNNL